MKYNLFKYAVANYYSTTACSKKSLEKTVPGLVTTLTENKEKRPDLFMAGIGSPTAHVLIAAQPTILPGT